MKTSYLLALVISSMLPAAGCGSSAQESETATLDPDAGQPEPGQPHAGQPPASTYAVRGTATGILEPVVVRLDVNGQSDRVIIEADGPFAFTIALADGDAYAVSVAGEPRCALASERGTVAGADPEVVIGCEGLVMLTDLRVMGPSAPEHLELSPMLLDYEAEVSLLQQAAVLVATAASAKASMTIAGMPAASGAPSEPIPLALGANQTAIQVTHPLGLEREYRITVSRALDIDQYAYGKASNTQAGDWFGYTMAISGDTLAIGAPSDDSAATGVDGDQSDNSASASGAVYIFRRTGSVWAQEAYLKASNTEAGDRFGVVVALDGDVVAVGARHEDSAATTTDGDQANNMAQDSGAVYVFRRTGSVWAQEAYLKAFNSNSGDHFGHSLALAGDVLAVGARREDSAATGVGGNPNDNSAMDSGAVYVYRRTPASWAHEAYLKASNTGAMDHFGESMALSGNTLAVGAYGEDSAATGVDGDQSDNSAEMSGAVYVFTHMGGTWRQQAYLKTSNSDPGDTFGSSVALAGNILAVGAYGESSAATGVGGDEADNGAPEAGAVYLFQRTAGEWAQAAYIKASNAQTGDWFGSSVALWGDTLAVGAVFEAGSASGIHGDEDDNGAPFSGAAYLFRRSGSSWSQTDYIKASNPGINDQFGWRVALGEDGLTVSALYESSEATGMGGSQSNNTALGSGAVYIFH